VLRPITSHTAPYCHQSKAAGWRCTLTTSRYEASIGCITVGGQSERRCSSISWMNVVLSRGELSHVLLRLFDRTRSHPQRPFSNADNTLSVDCSLFSYLLLLLQLHLFDVVHFPHSFDLCCFLLCDICWLLCCRSFVSRKNTEGLRWNSCLVCSIQ
jgi:hypothetical protein